MRQHLLDVAVSRALRVRDNQKTCLNCSCFYKAADGPKCDLMATVDNPVMRYLRVSQVDPMTEDCMYFEPRRQEGS
jgi:hypothetical protein